MIWLALRQGRAGLSAAAGLTGLLVALLVVAGARARGLGAAIATACATPPTARCAGLQAQLWSQYDAVAPDLGYLTITTVLVATFLGAPVVVREVETGTIDIAWCQSVSRRRWLGYRLATTSVVVGVLGLALGLAVSWCQASFAGIIPGRMAGQVWLEGPVLPAVWLLGLTLGVWLGTLLRRTLPAMAVTAVVTFVLALALNLTTLFFDVASSGPLDLGRQLLPATPPLVAAGALVAATFARLRRVGR